MAETKKYGQSGVSGNLELGKGGARIKETGGVIEHRNPGDTGYAVARGADPVADNDFVTKGYLEKNAEIAVKGEIYDSGGPLGNPASPAIGDIFIAKDTTGGFTVNNLYRALTTTAIASAVVGTDLEEIVPPEGLRITVTDALPNGGFSLSADHVYVWDLDGTTWVDIGPAATQVDVVKSEKLSFDFNDVGTNLIVQAPAGSTTVGALVNITTAFDGTPSGEVGSAGDADDVMDSTEVCLDVVGLYEAVAYVENSVATNYNFTIAATSPTQGAGTLELKYITH